MAKGKHSTALFEVIHSDKRFKQGHGSEAKEALRTPKWWFRGREKPETPTEAPLAEVEGDPTTSATARSMLSRGSTATAVEEPPPAPAPHNRLTELTAQEEPPAPPPQPPPAAAPPAVEERAPAPPAESPERSSPPRGRSIFSTVRYESADYDEPSPVDPTRPRGYLGRWGVQCTLHPDDRFLTLRLRYSAAAVLAGVTLLALVSAYVMGRSAGRSSATTVLATNSTAALQAGPAHPDVLDVAPTTPQRKSAVDSSRTNRAAESQQNLAAPPVQPQVIGTDTPQAHDLPRQINLNYVIIQSYPDRADAQEASALLIRNGVDCTIERALPRYSANQDWYVVVGTTGFAKVRSADFEAYIAKIKQIGAQGAAGKRTFKSFQPMGYKWTRPDRG